MATWEAYGIKRLRDLILELAMRGKLVPQDPDDEVASELMFRAAVEKKAMAKDRRFKRDTADRPIADSKIAFDLPVGWLWARINDVGHNWGQKTPDTAFTYIDVSAIDNALGVISAPSILNASDAPSRARKIVKKGTVIYSTVRPYLRNICVIEENYSPEPIVSTAFVALHPFPRYARKVFCSCSSKPDVCEVR